MPNLRFLPDSKKFSIKEIADIAKCKVLEAQNHDQIISSVNTLKLAKTGDISFLTNIKYKDDFLSTKATACIIKEGMEKYAPKGLALLVSSNPHASYAIAAGAIYAGYDKEVFADENSKFTKGKNCKISHSAEIGAGVEIGDDVEIHSFVKIGSNVTIGSGTIIKSGCVVTHAEIGEKCIIHPGAKIGQDGFGFAPSGAEVIKVPQLGGVRIGDNVEIGANCTIDRGALEDTEIGDYTKIDNLVQIGHNVKVGKYCFIVAQSGIAGSSVVGDQVMMGGQSGLNGHIKVGAKARIAGQSGVFEDVPEGSALIGTPAVSMREWYKVNSLLKKMIKK